MRWLAFPLLFALQAGVVFGAAPQSWDLSTYGQFLAGTFTNIALEREGVVRVAPSLDVVHESEQAVVWSVARSPDGSVYYGTGHQGAVFRVAPGGSGQLLWQAPEIEVFALAVGADGVLYVGTSPKGKVYKVTADGAASEFFDPGEEYIWSLAFDAQGRLQVGTGAGGKVYRVTQDGTGQAWFESGQRHVMSLAVDAAGNVLVGTDPDGILYRVSPEGKAFALHDSGSAGSEGHRGRRGWRDLLLRRWEAAWIASCRPYPPSKAPVAGTATIAPAGAAVAVQGVSSVVSYAQQPQVVYAGERSALMKIVDGRGRGKAVDVQRRATLGHVAGRFQRCGRAVRDRSRRAHLPHWIGPAAELGFTDRQVPNDGTDGRQRRNACRIRPWRRALPA